ncbi:MAG: hypothetical protein OXH00_02935 [Candidatus Poribacteria bacterium]|nr:hypothetical protein [Candidatus Poribacteria bacterium]
MVKEFQLMDSVGKVIGHGEIDGDVYRLFSQDAVPNAYKEFESLETMLAASGGTGIQPALFDSPARPRQLNLFSCSDKV